MQKSKLYGLKLDAATVQIVDRLYRGEIVPLVSKKIMEEYDEVLRRPKFRFPGELIRRLLEAIRQNGVDIEPVMTGEMLQDPKDLVFYEVAMTKQNDDAYLITGNIKHFPVKPFIVTPNEMLDILRNHTA